MLETIMMMVNLRDITNVGYDTCTHAAFHKALWRYYSRETRNFDNILLQICWSTRLPKITKIELGLTKLLQI